MRNTVAEVVPIGGGPIGEALANDVNAATVEGGASVLAEPSSLQVTSFGRGQVGWRSDPAFSLSPARPPPPLAVVAPVRSMRAMFPSQLQIRNLGSHRWGRWVALAQVSAAAGLMVPDPYPSMPFACRLKPQDEGRIFGTAAARDRVASDETHQ